MREGSLIPLEDAIRRLTSYPAQRLGLTDQGVLRVGAWVDFVIFNPDAILDKASYENPRQYPRGIEFVIVNGCVTVERGIHTGVWAGAILKGGSRSSPS